jgi:hexulose-6-phosphate isomerase
MRIAIMQGRLVPPQDGYFQCFPRNLWREEFPLAAAAGLDAIEWVYDLQGVAANPLGTDDGIREMNALSGRHGVVIASVCADYFIDRPFSTAGADEFMELTGHLRWLVERCGKAGITRAVLPFVDSSRIATAEQQDRIVGMLRQILPHAERACVELHLETSLEPKAFAALLDSLPHPFLKANYDSGNSASLGYNVFQELAAYGSRIGSVHVKDRTRGGGTVPLGSGEANIPGLLRGLDEIGYDGDYVLQVARAKVGDELNWAAQNHKSLQQLIEDAKGVRQ